MMLSGTNVELEVFAPDLTNAITQPVKSTISTFGIEFNDASFFDLNGDAFNVVPAQFDIRGSIVHYEVLVSGAFLNVPSDGFNGYVLTFDALGENSKVSIRDARILDTYNTLEVPEEFVGFSENSISVNVDGLSFSQGEQMEAVLDLRFDGGQRKDHFEGLQGNDLLLGRGGKDFLLGGEGQDTLKGGAGADVLSGGADADKLIGGAGSDVFVLNTGGGRDIVRDFSDEDALQIATSAETMEDLTFVQKRNSVIVRDDGASLVLKNVELDELTSDHFIF
ncbi:calcium-binding protein [Leisingera sp. S232]|uniref:calcium-binding protein n=1 Tax=Leisingera sp. S232 TaxID=3415132 RepID=UPI003C7B469E